MHKHEYYNQRYEFQIIAIEDYISSFLYKLFVSQTCRI